MQRPPNRSDRPPTRWGRRLLQFAGLLVLLFMVGFIRFATTLPQTTPLDPQGQAIVVLTGGGDRIAAGMSLLADDDGSHMLISGVNDQTNREDIRELIEPEHHEKFDCCVDLGKVAQNTSGNARESISWLESNGYNEVILVTAFYHMPRSLAELRNANPDLTVVAYPVFPDGVESGVWWRDFKTSRLLLTEYLKYLVAQARFRLNLG